ncbi:MAG: hypothetical protein PHC66_04110 [Candidatus Nanoarchaeia archaeon]|nr:hypothetical protein [Candidatus Nanoarchaeia archaeon]MDD5238890.1 hypothetical protein [Candidatus Nanoarchaeia archaeon]
MKLSRGIMWRDFEGKTFIGEYGNEYWVKDGMFFFGEKSAKINLISALIEDYYLIFRASCPDSSKPKFKKDLEYRIKTSYHAPTIGDYIAVSFTDKYARKNHQWGYVTSAIIGIQGTQ